LANWRIPNAIAKFTIRQNYCTVSEYASRERVTYQVITCTHAKIYFCHDSRSLRIVTLEYLQQEEWITRKMYSLHKYFKHSFVVPSSTSTYSFLSKKDIESANDSVGTAFAKKPATTNRVGLK